VRGPVRLLACWWIAGVALANTGETGWRAVEPRQAQYSTQALPTLPPLEPQGGEEPSGPVAAMAFGAGAAEVAPEIAALAAELGNDPERIFQYVRQKVEYQPYYGSAKGAMGTLLEGAGNAWDQSSLLIALLRAAGVTQVEYAAGAVFVRDWSPSGNDLEHWLGLRRELVPVAVFNSAGVLNAWDYDSYKLFLIEHVWVRAVVGGITYHLDPSYQRSTPHEGLDLATLSGFDAAQLRADAGGVLSGDSVSGVDRAAVEQRLASFAGSLRSNLVGSHAIATIAEVAGGSTRIGSASPTLGGGAPLAEFSPGVFFYENDLPASAAVNVRIRIGSQIDETLRADEIGSGRLTVAFGAGGAAELWHGDTLIASESTPVGTSIALAIDMDHPGSPIQAGAALEWDASLSGRSLLRTGTYDITPSVFPHGPATGRQEASQALLAAYGAGGLANGSRQMLGESLHLLGLQWVRQVALGSQLAANVRESFTVLAHVAGVCGQEGGFFVDMPVVTGLAANATGMDGQLFNAQIGLMSAFEHAVVEQMGAPRAVSTVKALAQANDEGQRVFRATSANWAAVSAQLVNYPPDALPAMASGVAAGATLVVHEDGALAMDDWTGFGYAQLDPGSSRMLIAGGLSGGFSTIFILIDGNLVAQRTYLDWLVDWRVLGTPEALSAEPVDLRTGSYLLRKTDLVLGQADSPRGLEFSRSYNSSRKGNGSLGLGWTHSCHGRIRLGNSPESAFGLLRSRDASPLLVATLAALEFADAAGPPKDMLLWVLAANWAADATTENTAFVELGDQRLVFSRNETGGWTRSAGTRTELEGTPGSFVLKPHLRGSIAFDTENRIAFWDDPDGNRRTYTYDPEGRLATVEDSVGRTLTFNYVDAQSPLLSGVSDSTGRSIGFAYSNGLLASATDPENFTSTFGYDAAGRLDLWTDPTGAPIARNFYDSEGRVVAQHSRGDPAREWNFAYRPGVTTENEPTRQPIALDVPTYFQN
jgi:YD repeat-containing protein